MFRFVGRLPSDYLHICPLLIRRAAGGCVPHTSSILFNIHTCHYYYYYYYYVYADKRPVRKYGIINALIKPLVRRVTSRHLTSRSPAYVRRARSKSILIDSTKMRFPCLAGQP